MSSSDHTKLLVGPRGAEHIRTALSRERPDAAIARIQQEHGLTEPSIKAAYPLFDFEQYARRDMHNRALAALRTQLIQTIKDKELDEEEFDSLLDKTLEYINIPQLMSIPLALLEKHPERPTNEMLERIKESSSDFQLFPWVIKRRIWKADKKLFKQHMMEALSCYHRDEELQRISRCMQPTDPVKDIKFRRNHPIVKTLCDILGPDHTLYDMFLEFLREVFESTPYPSISTLRLDLLMALHDADVAEIYTNDNIHQLAWSLDACVRTQSLDATRISNISDFLNPDRNRDLRENPPVINQDIAIILRDPFTCNLFASYVVQQLRVCFKNEIDPKSDRGIRWAISMLNYGCNADQVNEREAYKVPKAKENKFLQESMIGLMMEEDLDTSTVTAEELAAEERDEIEERLRKSEIARKIFTIYLLDRLEHGDAASLQRCLPLILHTLPESEEVMYTHTYESFFQTFVQSIIARHMPTMLMRPQMRRVVMDIFLVQAVRWSALVHELVVEMLVECYNHTQVGDALEYVETWAELVCSSGVKDDSERTSRIVELYGRLIQRSMQTLGGRYKLSPGNIPSVMNLLTRSSTENS
ncbi:uncharacterized protein VTP21DRAFT_4690 [Calcarisporiella thermophila]|uniref:uncharacterized protein n=1 Tax=Calcarisporiella thermophila TaxID=911321 RepID=UPI003742A620